MYTDEIQVPRVVQNTNCTNGIEETSYKRTATIKERNLLSHKSNNAPTVINEWICVIRLLDLTMQRDITLLVSCLFPPDPAFHRFRHRFSPTWKNLTHASHSAWSNYSTNKITANNYPGVHHVPGTVLSACAPWLLQSCQQPDAVGTVFISIPKEKKYSVNCPKWYSFEGVELGFEPLLSNFRTHTLNHILASQQLDKTDTGQPHSNWA